MKWRLWQHFRIFLLELLCPAGPMLDKFNTVLENFCGFCISVPVHYPLQIRWQLQRHTSWMAYAYCSLHEVNSQGPKWQIRTSQPNNKPKNNKSDPQIPQPDLRFAIRETANQQKKRGRAQQKTPTQKDCHEDTVTSQQYLKSKTCKRITLRQVSCEGLIESWQDPVSKLVTYKPALYHCGQTWEVWKSSRPSSVNHSSYCKCQRKWRTGSVESIAAVQDDQSPRSGGYTSWSRNCQAGNIRQPSSVSDRGQRPTIQRVA